MSYYLTDGASVPSMVSSNQGWYELTEWLEEQGMDEVTADFVETGETDDPEGMLNELDALDEPDDDNILTVLDTLKTFLKSNPNRVILSDGMVEDSEDEDDDD